MLFSRVASFISMTCHLVAVPASRPALSGDRDACQAESHEEVDLKRYAKLYVQGVRSLLVARGRQSPASVSRRNLPRSH